MSGQICVELLQAGQIEALRDLAIRAFRHTYEAHNDAEHLNAYIDKSFSLSALSADVDDANNVYLVALNAERDALLGYVKLSTKRTHPSVTAESAIEIERIYADPDAIGSGIGSALMTASISVAEDNTHDAIWLGVWQQNSHAINFYKRLDFEITGEQVFMMDSDEQRDFVMCRYIA